MLALGTSGYYTATRGTYEQERTAEWPSIYEHHRTSWPAQRNSKKNKKRHEEASARYQLHPKRAYPHLDRVDIGAYGVDIYIRSRPSPGFISMVQLWSNNATLSKGWPE